VVIPSRLWLGNEERINESLQKLKWIVLMVCGNEEADFRFEKIKHPMLRVWMQLPRMNQHNDVSYKLVNGYRPHTRELLKEIGLQNRTLDYFFAGQINHARREQCLAAILSIADSGVKGKHLTTNGFAKEAADQRTYLTYLAQTKIALCPSGVESPDTFRLYEALEAGCLPVVDAFSTNHQALGFWHYLFGEELPFPILPYWSDLPQLMPELLRDYPANANRCASWWTLKKRQLYFKLIDDVRILHG
jgi:hypothetical protein